MQKELHLMDPDLQEVTFAVLKATQPIGDIYVASVPFEILTKIAFFDVRRVMQEERDVEKYLGIQRPLNPSRVKELERYVTFGDATFPTAVILAVEDDYADYDEEAGKITLRNYRIGENAPTKQIREIARVIDGQHRIADLFRFRGANLMSQCPFSWGATSQTRHTYLPR